HRAGRGPGTRRHAAADPRRRGDEGGRLHCGARRHSGVPADALRARSYPREPGGQENGPDAGDQPRERLRRRRPAGRGAGTEREEGKGRQVPSRERLSITPESSMATDAIGGQAPPTLFLRKATGLVRGWSVRDSIIYAALATN